MRKFVLSALALFVCIGLTIAGEATFVKWDKEKKELTVKEDDKEATYKITDDTKIKMDDKDVEQDKALPRFEKMKEGKSKMEITVKDGKLTEIKMKKGKKQ